MSLSASLARQRSKHRVVCGICLVVILIALHLYDGITTSRQAFVLQSSSFVYSSESKSKENRTGLFNIATEKTNTTEYRSMHRVVVFEESFPQAGWKTSNFLMEEERNHIIHFDMPPASKSTLHQFTPDKDRTGCDYMEDWQRQTIAKPTCNMLHEVSIRMGSEPTRFSAVMEPMNRGSLRQVYSIHEYGSFHEEVLLKTSHDMESSEGGDNKYADAKEALIMDQCTFSPHIVDIHGWCYQSSLVERADGGLYDWVQQNIFHPVRLRQGQILPEISDRIVRVAIALAKGVADMQLIRHEGDVPKVVHRDIKIAQFLFKHSNNSDVGLGITIKLGDFNWAHLATSDVSVGTIKNNVSGNSTICPFPETKTHRTVGRSPEEYTKGSPLTDKIDSSTLGSLFFWLLTSDNVYEFDYSNATMSTSAHIDGVELPRNKAKKMIRAGIPPSFPFHVTQSSDKNIQALLKVILACKFLDPVKRPMPKDIVSFLQKSMQSWKDS